jgi:hypothetical protein|tara:strand:+ start:13944 stop:14168 length:225 start_codon:yes stop_codon:yes gene_type:complete
MQKTSQNNRTAIDKSTELVYNTDMTNNNNINRNNEMTIKTITKAEFGFTVEIIRNGEIVRRFECATMEEARRCE